MHKNQSKLYKGAFTYDVKLLGIGRYVKLHLMISDVGWWVGQRGSEVRSAICEFLLFPFVFSGLKGKL